MAAITVAADSAAMGGALVVLPFTATDDGIAAGEPTECFNPIAVVMRAEALSRKEGHVGATRHLFLRRASSAKHSCF